MKNNNQSGFSLIELLTVVALIGILSSIATQAFTLYKDKAQHSSAITLFNQLRTSLEGGKIESESFPEEIMEVAQQEAGTASGEYGQTLLKGLVIPPLHKIYVRHDPTCEDDLCLEDVVSVRHCQSSKIVTFSQFHSGVYSLNVNTSATDAC